MLRVFVVPDFALGGNYFLAAEILEHYEVVLWDRERDALLRDAEAHRRHLCSALEIE